MTILAAVCTKIPEAKLGIILLPVVSFSAGNVSVCKHIHVYLVHLTVCGAGGLY